MKTVFQKVLCLTAILMAGGQGLAGSDSRPGFVGQLEASNQAVVQRVVEGRSVDLVVLDGGWFEGFQTGMNCELMEGPARIAHLIIVDAWVGGAVALILEVEEDEIIEPGQVARPKLISATF